MLKYLLILIVLLFVGCGLPRRRAERFEGGPVITKTLKPNPNMVKFMLWYAENREWNMQ